MAPALMPASVLAVGQAEIVMAMDLELQIGLSAQPRHQLEGHERIEHAQSVGDPKAASAGVSSDRHHLHQKVRVRARESSPPTATSNPLPHA